jgi:hypothetical protein
MLLESITDGNAFVVLNPLRLLLTQNYVNNLLVVVDGGVKDADTINVQLDRVAAILATDVNNTDISTQMEVPAIVQ